MEYSQALEEHNHGLVNTSLIVQDIIDWKDEWSWTMNIKEQPIVDEELPINQILQGDCFNILKTLPQSSVDLVYLDPQFFTQRRQSSKNRKTNETYDFVDNWASIQEFEDYMLKRISLMRDVLKSSGSIILHFDANANHIFRTILDRVFGAKKFRT